MRGQCYIPLRLTNSVPTIGDSEMSITRRTLCNLLPALVPLALELPALADNDHAIISGAYPHSEMWLIREGVIELTVGSKNHRLEPGSVGFVNSNEQHGIRNVGTVPAKYFVIAVGPGAEVLE
jgi:hypothetical protein